MSHLKRREFIWLLGGAAATWPVAARTQQEGRVRRIGILFGGFSDTDPEPRARVAAFTDTLEQLGWTVGRNVQIKLRIGGGNADRVRAYAEELITSMPDVLAANSGPAAAALARQTKTVPIVFASLLDPVGSGLVESLARPGGNVTGFSTFEPITTGKWLRLLREMAPNISQVLAVFDRANRTYAEFDRAIEDLAPSLHLQYRSAAIADAAEIEHAIESFARDPGGGLIVFGGTITSAHRETIVRLAGHYRLPAIYSFGYYTRIGGLMSYGVDSVDLWRRAATYVDRILRGAKPADLPVQTPTKFELLINLTTSPFLNTILTVIGRCGNFLPTEMDAFHFRSCRNRLGRSEADMGNLDEHIFNDDLLANTGDHEVAHELYPTIEHVLYHQELVEYFKKYNDRADLAKKTSGRWGKWAIALGATAIALAAIEITVEIVVVSPWPLFIGAVAAICGVSSVTIGVFGVLFGSRKREWLHNRFMGERIRQFHFQSFIALLPEIVASLDGDKANGKAKFETARRKLFLQFKNEFDRNLDGQVTSLIGPYGEADWWLHESEREFSPANYQRELEPLFIAYHHLRIKHQLRYANFKLQTDHKIFSAMPMRQAEILENVSKAGIAWLLLIHVSVLVIVLSTFGVLVLGGPLVSAIGHAASLISIVFSVAIIVIAVVALSARAFQQGLQPEREIERYQKIRVMRQMERVAFDEMRNFVRTHDRSSFAM